MTPPEPTPTSPAKQIAQGIAQNIGTGGSNTATPTKTPTATPGPFDSENETSLRRLWRAGFITEEQYDQQMRDWGKTDAQIIAAKQVGISTAAATKGQLTPEEQNAVNALKRDYKPPTATSVPAPATATPGPASAAAGGRYDFGSELNLPPGGSQVASATASGQSTNNADMAFSALSGPGSITPPSLPGAGMAATASEQARRSGQGGGQGGTGSAPAKSKNQPVQLVQQEDGSYAWKRLIGKDSEGRNIYEDASRPPVMEGFSPEPGKEGTGWIWDEGAGVYRPVKWVNDAERGGERIGDWKVDYDPSKAKLQPQTITNSGVGTAIRTGKQFAPDGTPYPTAGTQNAPLVEGFQGTGSIGGGETNIFNTQDPDIGMLSTAQGTRPVSTMGVPVMDGQQGLAISGQAAGSLQANSPGMGVGTNARAVLAAYGAKLSDPNDPFGTIQDMRNLLRIEKRKAELEKAGLDMYAIQRQISSEEGYNVDNSMFPSSKSSNSSQGAAETREAGGLRAILGRQYMNQQELPNGGRDEIEEPQLYARGGKFLTRGPLLMMDMMTRQPVGIAGGAGVRERVTIDPVRQPTQRGVAQEAAMANRMWADPRSAFEPPMWSDPRMQRPRSFAKGGMFLTGKPMGGPQGELQQQQNAQMLSLLQGMQQPAAPTAPMASTEPTIVPGPYSEQILGGSNIEPGKVVMSQAEANELNLQWAAQQAAANQATFNQGVANVERQDVINNSDVYGAAGLPLPVADVFMPVNQGGFVTAGPGVRLVEQPKTFFDPASAYEDPRRNRRGRVGAQTARNMGEARRRNRWNSLLSPLSPPTLMSPGYSTVEDTGRQYMAGQARQRRR